jgi:hypothetical protein
LHRHRDKKVVEVSLCVFVRRFNNGAGPAVFGSRRSDARLVFLVNVTGPNARVRNPLPRIPHRQHCRQCRVAFADASPFCCSGWKKAASVFLGDLLKSLQRVTPF